MTVRTVPEYQAAVCSLKLLWGQFKRSTFTVGDMESLIGKLGRIGQAFWPIYHRMPHMYSSVTYTLQENASFLMSTSRRFRALMKQAKAASVPAIEEDEREINVAIGEVDRQTHNCNRE